MRHWQAVALALAIGVFPAAAQEPAGLASRRGTSLLPAERLQLRVPSGIAAPAAGEPAAAPGEELLRRIPFLGPLTLRARQETYTHQNGYSRVEGITVLRLVEERFTVSLEKERLLVSDWDRRHCVTFRWNLNAVPQ